MVITTNYSNCVNRVSGAGGFQVSDGEWGAGVEGNGPQLLQCVSSAGRTAAQPEKKDRCVPLHGDLFYQTG